VTKSRRTGLKFQVAISLCILVGLFFVEYPPIFLIGYWSWGALAHKTLSGALIAVNLLITQYSVRRLGYFRSKELIEDDEARKAVLGS